MPTMFDDVDAICPFFRSSEKKKIICDGITEECSTHILFGRKEARDLHRKVFCNHKYKNCEIYAMLEKCNEE